MYIVQSSPLPFFPHTPFSTQHPLLWIFSKDEVTPPHNHKLPRCFYPDFSLLLTHHVVLINSVTMLVSLVLHLKEKKNRTSIVLQLSWDPLRLPKWTCWNFSIRFCDSLVILQFIRLSWGCSTKLFQNVVVDRCTAAARLMYSLFLQEAGDTTALGS